MNEPEHRIFLALPLATIFISEIEAYLQLLQGKIKGVKWAEPEGVHVTFHFFGKIGSEQIKTACSIVEAQVVNISPLSLTLNGLGCFPNPVHPRIIWLGITGDTTQLTELQNKIEKDLKNEGFPVEAREFHAHATLGRVKHFDPSQTALSSMKQSPSNPRIILELALFESHLGPKGSHYEIIKTFRLSGPKAG
ncbi:MAG: RNA 2',3'-cyclic phosphodiesterase [Candidatus Omnitrophica bacterium]|nr:RNA 2',3'-cyclic phosphodiesterase [Candidatus Omnitrophota bacterium]